MDLLPVDVSRVSPLVEELRKAGLTEIQAATVLKIIGSGGCFDLSCPTSCGACALNLIAYEKALADLERLLQINADEHEFQRLLGANPWMFGSEYARLLPKRTITVGEQQDFLLTRTTDDRLELVEIKTPLGGRDLFTHDRSHDTLYQTVGLSRVIAQVQHYLAEFDGKRDHTLRKLEIDTYKATARIVIGRDGDKAQMEALKRTNAHLHRIEIITFDSLLRIARRVFTHMSGRDDHMPTTR